MSDTPDLVQTLAVVAPLLGVPFRFTGVSTLHDKECDRVNALCNEMRKLGIVLDVENNDTIAWEGDRCPIFERPVIDTYHDHRMAMAFAAAAIYAPGIIIKDVEVVNKSYPRFWDDLRDAGFTIETQSPEGADA
jgi:3-phosphoshikimate 1-carboxyvinyltransferase